MSSAWTFQEPHQLRDLGPDKAAWYVGWYEPDGRKRTRSFGPGKPGEKLAGRFKRKVESELMTGTYAMHDRKLWADFRKEYTSRIVSGLSPRSRPEVEAALNHFERLLKPVRVFAVCTGHVDDFIARRRKEPGKKKGSLVSPATVNKDLRHLKAALGVAVEWGYLKQLPRFRMERVPKKLVRYVPGDHFAAIYAACEAAKKPAGLPYPAADWWRAVIVTGYMTGWRIGDMLNLRREDVDLDNATAVIRWESEGNKGKRDELVKLHPVVVEHWRKLAAFTPELFPWLNNRRTLDEEYLRIQKAAGIELPCREKHEHTPHCHVYGFHDLRRAFATMNADKLSPDALQALMRHKSYQTTQVYINMARQMDEAVASLHVPEVLRRPASKS